MDFRGFYDATRAYHHNLVAVLLTRPESLEGGPEDSTLVENVQAGPVTLQDVDSPLGGRLDGERRNFHLWAADCDGLVPGEDWLVTEEDGTVWRVLERETLAHGRRYRLKTIKKQG